MNIRETVDHCRRELQPGADRFNAEQDAATSKVGLSSKLGFPCVVIGLVIGYQSNRYDSVEALVWFGAGGVLLLVAFAGYARKYYKRSLARKAFAAEIKAKALKHFNPQIQFSASAKFPVEAYGNCGIFPENYSRASAENHLSGSFGDIKFELTEVSVYGRSGKSEKTLLRGFLLRAQVPRTFAGHTTVCADPGEGMLGSVARMAQRLVSAISDAKLVEMDYQEFEENFMVHSTNTESARRFVTRDLMMKMLAIDKHFPGIQFAFWDSEVYIAVPHDLTFIGWMGLDGELTKAVECYLTDITKLLQFVDDLKAG